MRSSSRRILRRRVSLIMISFNDIIDLPASKLKLASGAMVPLRQKAHGVKLAAIIRVPPRSEMEVRGQCCTLPSSGLWFLEGQAVGPHQSIIAARAILEATSYIPVPLLNTSDRLLPSMKAQCKIGELQEVEVWENGTVSSHPPMHTKPGIEISAEKHLAESTTTTSSKDKNSFFTFLLQYADIFACPGDTGLGVHQSSSTHPTQHQFANNLEGSL